MIIFTFLFTHCFKTYTTLSWQLVNNSLLIYIFMFFSWKLFWFWYIANSILFSLYIIGGFWLKIRLLFIYYNLYLLIRPAFYVTKRYYKTSYFFLYSSNRQFTPLLSCTSIILYCNHLMFVCFATYYRKSINIWELMQKCIFSFEYGMHLNIFSSIIINSGILCSLPTTGAFRLRTSLNYLFVKAATGTPLFYVNYCVNADMKR